MPLSPRQKRILKAIIEDYVTTAEPVASRALSKKFDLGVSPATLRNEMADLEEEGLLRQPHTSAGRVPSDSGYRLFVDALMEPETDLNDEAMQVLGRYQLDARDLNDILQQAAKVTAVLAQCTAMVQAPRVELARVNYLQLLPVAPEAAMLVILTDRGTTLSQLVPLPAPLDGDELVLLTNFLNAHLRGQPLGRLSGLDKLLKEMAAYEATLRVFFQRLASAQGPQGRVFVSSASLLAQQPEFGDAGKLRGLLCLLEREEALSHLLSTFQEGEATRIVIGHENPLADLHACSVVSAPYAIGGRTVGEIGVIGPTRLHYSRAVLAVETVARSLTRTLTRLFYAGTGGTGRDR